MSYPHILNLGYKPGKKPRYASCIVPTSKWDGKTGIPQLRKQYREDNSFLTKKISRI